MIVMKDIKRCPRNDGKGDRLVMKIGLYKNIKDRRWPRIEDQDEARYKDPEGRIDVVGAVRCR